MNQPERDLELRILKNTISIFNMKGLKFTMDDVARGCGISKKTIYTVFEDKNALFLSMVDMIFNDIKIEEERIMNDDSLPLKDKIQKLMSAMPETYGEIDFRKLYELKDKYPLIYKEVEERLETGWEDTIALLKKGQEEGIIKKDVRLNIVKVMMESTLEHFFQRDVLIRSGLSYQQGLNQVVSILMEGIING